MVLKVWSGKCLQNSFKGVSKVKTILNIICLFHICGLHAQSPPTICNPRDCSLSDSSVCGIFPGKNTGVGCHFLLQGILLALGLYPHLLNWQVDSLPLSHQQSPLSMSAFPQIGPFLLLKYCFDRGKFCIRHSHTDVKVSILRTCFWGLWWGRGRKEGEGHPHPPCLTLPLAPTSGLSCFLHWPDSCETAPKTGMAGASPQEKPSESPEPTAASQISWYPGQAP